MEIKFISMVFLLFFVRSYKAAKIHNITVPSYYLVDDKSPRPLILDCEVTVDTNEKSFVLKWFHNFAIIYQWIPHKTPFALGTYKDRIDINNSPFNGDYKQFSALTIRNPSIIDSGNFSCDIQSTISSDRKTAQMIVVHPETSINIKYTIDEIEKIVNLECSVYNIYPEPEIRFLFDDKEKSISIDIDKKEADNLLNVTITGQISKNDIRDESPVTCWMKINDTDYEKKETILYDDPKQTSTTKKTNDGENMFASQLNDENAGVFVKPSLETYYILLLNLMFAQRFFEL